jgi:urea carboxylase
MWRTLPVRAGQVLTLAGARTGARTYIAFAGAIDTPPVLGSRATFHMAGVGGVEGFALKPGQKIPLGKAAEFVPLREVRPDQRPQIGATREWVIECMLGPNDDWLDAASVDMFFGSNWTVQAKSNRTGIRLTGPTFNFSKRAVDKRPEHGQDPSNILDHGYPLGAVNLAGQTPIVLINDAPSTGGFINPFTVPSAAFWKLGQAQPHNILRFRRVTLQEAQDLRRALDARCCLAALQEL